MAGSRWLRARYYLFRATNSAGFYLPVAILYLDQQGYGLDFIAFSYAVFAFASVAAEVPTGYLGDWLGRRGSLAVGAALRALVLVAYPLADSAGAYLALHVVWATGRAARSGTADAWLYELLKTRGEESEFTRVESRGSTVLLVTSAVGAVVGASLYTVDAAYPFWINAVLITSGIPLLATFPAVAPDEDGVFTARDAVRSLRLQAGRPEVRWLVAYAALFAALFSVTRVYEQPGLREVGIPVAGLGVLYALFKLVSAGAASTAAWLEGRLGTRRVFALLAPAYGLAYASIAVAPALFLPVLFFNRGRRVVTRPIRNQYLNDRLADVGRATVLSGAAMATSVVAASARVVAGVVAPALGVLDFLPLAGVALAGAAGVLWLATSPVRTDEGVVAPRTDGEADASVAPTD